MKKLKMILLASAVAVLGACNAGNADNPSNSAESSNTDSALQISGDTSPALVTDSVQVDSPAAGNATMR
jgi:outer membrane biogenesis lipoprotein LolB